MKKIIFGLLATVLFGNISYSQSVKEVSVKFTFEIGRNSRNCAGFGLCTKKSIGVKIDIKLEPPCDEKEEKSSRKGLNLKEFNAYIHKDSNEKLTMYLDKNNLEFLKSTFKNDNFILEEDFIFNDETLEVKNYIFKAGTYKYSYDSELNRYFITF